jgi:hypothetical protein
MSSDIYFNPEEHGLRKIAEHDLSEPCYSFDLVVCWADDSGGFYLGTDSGCSCPSPFESYGGKEDLTGPLSREQAVSESKSIRKASYEPNYDPEGWKTYKRAIREA